MKKSRKCAKGWVGWVGWVGGQEVAAPIVTSRLPISAANSFESTTPMAPSFGSAVFPLSLWKIKQKHHHEIPCENNLDGRKKT